MKKLNQISTLSAAFLAGQSLLNAQIIYTNEDPDLQTFGAPLLIDMDEDGLNDIRIDIHDQIWTTSWRSFYATVEQVEAGWSFIYFSGFTFFPSALGYGDMISAAEAWGELDDATHPHAHTLAGMTYFTNSGCESTVTGLGLGVTFGNFFNTEKYFGVRHEVAGGYNYGWMRLSTEYQNPCPAPWHDGLRLFVHDFAMQLTLNEPLTAGEGACAIPEPLGAFFITGTSAKLKWDLVPGSETYKVWYRPVGAVTWTKKKATTNKKLITGLLCNTNYEWKVRSECDGIITDFSTIQNFTTASCRLTNEPSPEISEITFYPNPAHDFIYIDPEGNDVQIEIYDLTGKQLEFLQSQEDEFVKIDISHLPNGIYLISFKSEEGVVTRELVKL